MTVIQPTIVQNGGGGGSVRYTGGEGISVDNTDNIITNTAIPDVDKAYVDNAVSTLSDNIGNVYTAVGTKITMPSDGTAGQVLGLDDNLEPQWVTAGGGGGTPTNMVTTDTNQTISGTKTFNSGSNTTDLVVKTADYAMLTLKSDRNGGSSKIISNAGNGLIIEHDYEQVGGVTIRAKGYHPTGVYNPEIKVGSVIYPAGVEASFNTKITGAQIKVNLRQNGLQVEIDDGVSPTYAFIQNMTDVSGDYVWNGDHTKIRSSRLALQGWVKSLMPDVTFTGDGSSSYTVSHSLGKIPSIVQVTDSNGVVLKDSEITITKTTTNVTVAFETAPSDGTYTVGMLY